jgi:hypothetical protein
MTKDNGVLAQLYEYREKFKNKHYPVRQTVDGGKIYDERHGYDEFGNPVVARAMRVLQPHPEFKEIA